MVVEGLRREGFFARLICQGDLNDDASYKEKEKEKEKKNQSNAPLLWNCSFACFRG